MKDNIAHAPYILRKKEDETPAKCIKCNEERLPVEYHKHSVRGDGYIRYRQICKFCRKKVKRNKAKPVYERIISEGKQLCKYCNTVKSLDNFYANGCFSDGLPKYRSRCKGCILENRKEKQPETYADKIVKKHSSAKNYISTLLNHCSKRKNKDSNLDIGYLLDLYEKQKGFCGLSGIEMTYEYGKKTTNISIDRIDNSKGYLKGNVHFVCYLSNVMKSEFTIQELLYFAEKIVTYSQNKTDAEVKI
jgi:hypothetical protein